MIFIYSGAVDDLDGRLREVLGPQPTFTMIPCSPDDLGTAKEAAAWYQQAGIRARCLSRAYYLNPRRLYNAILASDAVYLCGGNTYEFLDWARGMDLFPLLRRFEEQGGVIAAESAGSIILSPDIATAGIPGSDPDPDTIGVQDLTAMGRLDFHISPHFDPLAPQADSDLRELQELADDSAIPVLVLEDGEGVIVQGDEIVFEAGTPVMLRPDQVRQPVLASPDAPVPYLGDSI